MASSSVLSNPGSNPVSKRAFAAVIAPYWRSSEKWGAWALLALLVFLLLIRTGLQVVFLIYGGELTSALAAQQSDRFFQAVLVFAGILVVSVPFASLSGYVRDKLGLYWRTWLTHSYLNRYLGDQTFYRLRIAGEIDNPDQRIEEDVRTLTRESLKLFEIGLESIFQMIGFAGLLWAISPPLMVFLLAYSIVGSAIAFFCFGRPLIRINAEQLKREADFRYDLARIRDNSEAIALYRGETQERAQSWQQFRRVFSNFTHLIRWQLGLNLFQNHYRYATFIIPGVILAPRLFAGELEIGDVTQAGAAFTLMLSALALIVLQLQQLTSLGAATQRLQKLTATLPASFSNALNLSDTFGLSDASGFSGSSDFSNLPVAEQNRITYLSSSDSSYSLIIENLSLATPDGQKQLINNLSLSLPAGESLLVMGPSGVGKSSLLRAIAGLWQTGKGKIVCPQPVAFIPQRPYLPPGSLRHILFYPFSEEYPSSSLEQTVPSQASQNNSAKTDEIRQILERVNLFNLCDHPLEAPLTQPLSLGEQQRLAFARILLRSSAYVILDEATSALDLANETLMYQHLRNNNIVFISVGHRPSLMSHHQHLLTLLSDGTWQYEHVE